MLLTKPIRVLVLVALAWACLAPELIAQTNIGNATWTATGSSTTTRTAAVRASEIRNVMDFGANGNGIFDNSSAIQAAINAACADGNTTNGTKLGGNVFFPPGAFKVNTEINGSPGNCSLRITGASKLSTSIFGNIASGCVINKPDSTNGLDQVENITIKNTNTSAGSCGLRLDNAQQGSIRASSIQGFNALDVSSNAYSTIISDSDISCTPGNGVGTVGAYAGEVGFYNSSITGCEVGIQASNSAFTFISGRVEVNTFGFILGKDKSGATSQLSGAVLSGFEMEGNYIGIYVFSAVGLQVSGVTITGVVGETHDSSGNTGLTAANGILVHSCTQCVFSAISSNVQVSGASIDLSDASLNVANVVFQGVQAGTTPNAVGTGSISVTTMTITAVSSGLYGSGFPITGTGVSANTVIVKQLTGSLGGIGTYQVNNSQTVTPTTLTGIAGAPWLMPVTSKAGISYLNSNNPTTSFLFHDLPGEAGFGAPPTAIEGMRFGITDGALSGGGTAAPGQALQGSGVQHIPVYRTNSAWIYN